MGSLPNGQIVFFRLHLPTTGDFAILNKTVFTASYAAPLTDPPAFAGGSVNDDAKRRSFYR